MSRSLVAITGASSGIGATFARKLASGHDLLLIARRADKLATLAAELSSSYGTQTEIMAVDLASDAGMRQAAERLRSDLRLTLLINNAGFGTKGRFWEAALSGQEEMHRLHVLATVCLTHAALGNMVSRNVGGIINVSSVASFIRSAGNVSYTSTKSWMTVFTEGLYLELKSIGSNVTVQALCPGFTYSEFHDTMQVNRQRLAPPAFWMTADQVVDASLAGLARRKLIVVPGWPYRLLTAIVSKLPLSLRLAVETSASKRRNAELPSPERNLGNSTLAK